MIGRQFKRCSQCQQSKPLTAFYLNAGARAGRADTFIQLRPLEEPGPGSEQVNGKIR